MNGRHVDLEILRYNPETDEEPAFQAYRVPCKEDWVVLDAVNYIKDVLDRTLIDRFDLDETARAVVFTAMDGEAAADPDLQRICAEAGRLTSMPERIEILQTLFDVALADGQASKAEVAEIRRIADLLWISRPEYFAVHDRFRDRIEP